jgi:hypothetical protein
VTQTVGRLLPTSGYWSFKSAARKRQRRVSSTPVFQEPEQTHIRPAQSTLPAVYIGTRSNKRRRSSFAAFSNITGGGNINTDNGVIGAYNVGADVDGRVCAGDDDEAAARVEESRGTT